MPLWMQIVAVIAIVFAAAYLLQGSRLSRWLDTSDQCAEQGCDYQGR